MIIWINGAFGSGKTNTAYELKRRIPNSFIYDPEEVGFFIRDNLPAELKKDDFQKFPMWRAFNYEMIKYIDKEYKGVIIAPMTITSEAYFKDIVTRIKLHNLQLKHFTLIADKETLLKRLRKRGDGKNSWPAQQIDRCIDALSSPLFEEHISTDDMSIEQVVEHIANVCGIELLPDTRNWITRKKDQLVIWLRHIRLFS
jgi:broad-specificity NMP kinase